MRYSLPSFYGDFYGLKFFRHFRRLYDFKTDKIRRQFTVKNPKELYLHVHKNSGFHACMVHVYDHGSYDNLNGHDQDLLCYDRAFFDFDVENQTIKQIKEQLITLRENGPFYKEHLQVELKQQLQNLIVDKKIAEPAITEAKKFSKHFKESFGSAPALFFSGCKGCHAYAFFSPSEFYNIETALTWFAKKQKENYLTLDLAVVKDATSRLSRVPYSEHQLTGLTVIPFTMEDNYNEIMEKALKPVVKPFDHFKHLSKFDEHLVKIDEILEKNRELHETERTKELKLKLHKLGNYKNRDHKIFFRNILGEPEKEYPKYIMYHCPFPDHDDNKPSFMVHEKGYKCYGCERKGNYWQFLKDYNNWNDEQVKTYLMSKKSKINRKFNAKKRAKT